MANGMRRLTGGLLAAAGLTLAGCGGVVDEAAEKEFLGALGRTSVTVYPAAVHSRAFTYDARAAQALVQCVNDAGLTEARLATEEVPLQTAWTYNQAKMFRDSARAFAAWVQEHPPQTPYAALPEYLMLGPGRDGQPGGVGGVHLYVVDRNGKVVSGILLNSHHAAFSQVDPKSPDDCTQVLCAVLAEDWRPVR